MYFLGVRFVCFPFLHGFLSIKFSTLLIFSLPMVLTCGRGRGLGKQALVALFSSHRFLHDISLFPGGSSRTCRTMHLTKSPTSSSWSKSWDWPLPLLPSHCPTFPTHPYFTHPQTRARQDPSPQSLSPLTSPDWPEPWVEGEGLSHDAFLLLLGRK